MTLAFRSAVLTAAAMVLASCAADTDTEPTAGVTIDRIITLSDGDHVASTYVDGVLAPPDAGFRDVLTTVSITDGDVATAEVAVSNSVTAAPEVLAVTPDGGTAFVAERLAQRAPSQTRAAELALGTRLTAVDVTDLAAPQVISEAMISEGAESISVSPDGLRIAIVANARGRSVVELVEWTGTSFGTSSVTDLATLGITAPPDTSVAATNVHWHPAGNRLAVNLNTLDQVAFFDVDDRSALRPWGAPVAVGVDPFVGRFTPDGAHYVTANWGRDLSTTVADDRLPDDASTVSVIRVDEQRVVAEAATDTSSEGIAISPDGSLVATVNMRGTVFPPDSPKFDEEGSVSLLRIADDGALTKVGDYPLTAVLPEGGTFDATGEYFIATSFQGRGDDGGSGLQIYRVDDDAGLVPVQRVPLPHGAHHVVVG